MSGTSEVKVLVSQVAALDARLCACEKELQRVARRLADLGVGMVESGAAQDGNAFEVVRSVRLKPGLAKRGAK